MSFAAISFAVAPVWSQDLPKIIYPPTSPEILALACKTKCESRTLQSPLIFSPGPFRVPRIALKSETPSQPWELIVDPQT
jgi:hypothetical protein